MLEFMKLNWNVRLMQANCADRLGQKVLGGDERTADIGDDQAEPKGRVISIISLQSVHPHKRPKFSPPPPHEVH